MGTKTEKAFREEVRDQLESIRKEFTIDPVDLDRQIREFRILPSVLVQAEWEEGESETYKGLRTTEWVAVSPITGNEVVIHEIENPVGMKSYSYDTAKRMCESFDEAATIALRRDLDGALSRPDPTPAELAAELAAGVSLAAASVGRDVAAILAMARSLAEMTGMQDSRYWNFRAKRPSMRLSKYPQRDPAEVPCYLVGSDGGNGWRTVLLSAFPDRVACYCDQVEGQGRRCENAPPIPIGDPVYRYLGVEHQHYDWREGMTTCEEATQENRLLLERAAMETDPELRRSLEINAEEEISSGDIYCVCASDHCKNLDDWRVM